MQRLQKRLQSIEEFFAWLFVPLSCPAAGFDASSDCSGTPTAGVWIVIASVLIGFPFSTNDPDNIKPLAPRTMVGPGLGQIDVANRHESLLGTRPILESDTGTA